MSRFKRRLLGISALVVCLLGLAGVFYAGDLLRVGESAVTDRLWSDYLENDKALKNDWKARPKNKQTRVAELTFRVERDQRIRDLVTEAMNTEGAKPDQAPMFWLKLKGRMDEIDQANQAWLKEQLKEVGWFTISEYGKEADNNAFLIVQHATNDREFQKKILRRFKKLKERGEIDPAHYALLYDRISAAENNIQRYGSALTCENGAVVLKAPLENEDKVDQWRREMGLPPLDAYMQTASKELGDCSLSRAGD